MQGVFWFELVRAEGGKHCKRFRTKDGKKQVLYVVGQVKRESEAFVNIH